MDEQTLMAAAVKMTIHRRKIRTQALEADRRETAQIMNDPEVSTSLASRIMKGYHSQKKLSSINSLSETFEETPIGQRKQRKRKAKIGVSEKLDIGYRVIMMKESQADLAKEFCVSRALIS
jgi:hypothetical protein